MNADRQTTPELPDVCQVAFKEWEGICRALATGHQSLILRKGGIDEGPGGFVPEYGVFWLYPTHGHQAQQGLKTDAVAPDHFAVGTDGTVRIDTLAAVSLVVRVEHAEQLLALEDFHVWTADTIEKRFAYREPGLWVLGVRTYRLPEPLRIEVSPDHLGCKTWVSLGQDLPTRGLQPVLDDDTFRSTMRAIEAALSGLTPL